jgi:hypothetical protein
MKIDHAWALLDIIRAGSLTVFSILLITVMGGALLPVVGDFITDMLLWFALASVLAVSYVRAAYAHRRRLAAQTDASVSFLVTLSDVAYEVLSLLGGGFFGVLCASLAWSEYRKNGVFGGHAPLMAGLAVVGLCACISTLVKLGRYLRRDMTVDMP